MLRVLDSFTNKKSNYCGCHSSIIGTHFLLEDKNVKIMHFPKHFILPGQFNLTKYKIEKPVYLTLLRYNTYRYKIIFFKM